MAKQTAKKARKYSRPSLKYPLVVNSEMSIEAVNSYVKRTLSALYQLDVILYFIGSEGVADAANEKVETLFDEKSKSFNREINKLQSKIIDLEDLEEIAYTEQKACEFIVYSPLSARYLKLIKKFEITTNLIDKLWMNAEMSSSDRKRENSALRSHLRNISQQIINLARNAMKVAKNEGKEELVVSEMAGLGITKEDTKEVMDTNNIDEAEQEAEAEEAAA